MLVLLFFTDSGSASAETYAHLYAGANATQVTLKSKDETTLSNGYASYSVGTGLSYRPMSLISLQADGFFANRKFGFGETSAAFSTLQFPVTAQVHFWQFRIGAGAYAAFWNFDGEMMVDGQRKTISSSAAGQTSKETGIVLLGGFQQVLFGYPIRFELRNFRSMGDIAKSDEFKGTLAEWQLLAGYDFNLDPFVSNLFGGKKSSSGPEPAEAPPTSGATP